MPKYQICSVFPECQALLAKIPWSRKTSYNCSWFYFLRIPFYTFYIHTILDSAYLLVMLYKHCFSNDLPWYASLRGVESSFYNWIIFEINVPLSSETIFYGVLLITAYTKRPLHHMSMASYWSSPITTYVISLNKFVTEHIKKILNVSQTLSVISLFNPLGRTPIL